MKKWLFLWLAALLSMTVTAQKRVGDFIESVSYNDDKRGQVRTVHYFPADDGFFCVNGTNRFTRALYGGHTSYRLETSDRPVFALFKDSRNCRNVQFRLTVGRLELALDSVETCQASYRRGIRNYRLADKRWGEGVLDVTAVCLNDSDAALWRFVAQGFNQPLMLSTVVSTTREPRLHRNGDIGADKPGCFEAADVVSVKEWTFAGSDTTFVRADGLEVSVGGDWREVFNTHLSQNEQLAHLIEFRTPEPWLNVLDDALVFAADGAWDGQTWLHGAIGWRMPLAGWRAGYLGDVLGWRDRAISHFEAYARSQVTDVPPVYCHPAQDSLMNLARAEKKWGTPMYSNGYICRNPNRNDQMHHYDMNLNYIDELLWHFQYDADTAFMRRMWPVLTRHLAWEKRNYDPDDDGLYDAYCCIWASDALYYSGGAVTHSSAYNYRGNLLAAKVARILGEDEKPFQHEAEKILEAMNRQLWVNEGNQPPHWAEYKDMRGVCRVHDDAALWSIYTPVDCGAGSPEQMFQATQYVTDCIPHIPIVVNDSAFNSRHGLLSTVSTSDWMPYSWSINNVASAEVMNTATAYFKAGRPAEGYNLLKANVMDQMFLGSSPGNFGQISFHDAARGECYRDFSDNTGTSARTLLQGLFGIVPQALDGACIIRPGFPVEWDSCEVRTPYLSYAFKRVNGKEIFRVEQHFPQPLRVVLRQNLADGRYRDYVGTTATEQTFEISPVDVMPTFADVSATHYLPSSPSPETLGLVASASAHAKYFCVPLTSCFNANVSDIFKQEYCSPRPSVTTLQIPLHGIGEWCHPQLTAEINDSVFRSLAVGNRFMVEGVTFATPQQGHNVVFTSLWDNYPDSITVNLKKKRNYRQAHLLLAGSTNHMQTHIDNAIVTAEYADGTQDTLRLIPPYNWCPIEQDYFVDGMAFRAVEPRPLRVCLGTGDVSRDLGRTLGIQGVYGREIPGGAAQVLSMPLNARKKLKALTLRTLSSDVVVGLMAVTLEQ